MNLQICFATALVCAACAPAPTNNAATSQPDAAQEPPPPACEQPISPGRACESVGDCFDADQCTDEICDTSTPIEPPDPSGRRYTCRWTGRPSGAACDLSGQDTVDACIDGRCCAIGGAR
jgi:hypothetical protein